MMESAAINHPEIVTEVGAVFMEYEAALLANDVAALNQFFWNHPSVVRYGVAEQCYGHQAICDYRLHATPVHPQRQLRNTVITTFGQHTASVCTEFVMPGSNDIGRQTQTWVRFTVGWRIVAAHVSTVKSG